MHASVAATTMCYDVCCCCCCCWSIQVRFLYALTQLPSCQELPPAFLEVQPEDAPVYLHHEQYRCVWTTMGNGVGVGGWLEGSDVYLGGGDVALFAKFLVGKAWALSLIISCPGQQQTSAAAAQTLWVVGWKVSGPMPRNDLWRCSLGRARILAP
jgi:hypothetical protein